MSSQKEKEEVVNDPFADAEVQFKGERPWISRNANAPRFGANDLVYVNLGNGPIKCIIVKVNDHLVPPTYVLETEEGMAINGGRAVNESNISKNA